MGIMAALLVYSYSITRWVTVLFLAEAMIAETVVLCPIREHESPASQECQNGPTPEGYQLLPLQETTNMRGAPLLPSSSGAEASTTATDSRQRRLCRLALCTITIIIGLYLMSAPDYCISRTPGYRTLSVLIPPHDERDWRFYPSVGAILLVAALAHSPRDGLLVRGLESRLIQYLNRISYSLYLVYGPVMHGVGYRVFPLIWAAVGRVGWRDPVGFVLGWLVVFSVVFYIADRVMVAVDEPCVRFGRWVEQRMLAAAH
jgi:peptidoglycan/LPS O-acetylase OafA/YrhL